MKHFDFNLHEEKKTFVQCLTAVRYKLKYSQLIITVMTFIRKIE